MGCLWSSESSREKCIHCGRKAVNNLVIINQKCEICTGIEARRLQLSRVYVDRTSIDFVDRRQIDFVDRKPIDFVNRRPTAQRIIPKAVQAPATRACFGVYRCKCGRHWESRLSWPNTYQICKRDSCKSRVYPHSQRPLKPSDIRDDKETFVEHQKHLCQRCQQLGHYCGNSTRKNRKRNL